MYVIEKDGQRQHVNSLEPWEGWVVVGQKAGEAEAVPDFASWDEATGKFKVDEAKAADQRAGAAHIERMHAIKQAEAAMFASGFPLTHGVIAEEAAALKVPAIDLAAAILDAAKADRAAEVERRKAKARK